MNVSLLELLRVSLKRIDVIREYDDLVSSRLMVVDQELAGLVLVRIHAVEEHSLARLLPQVLAVELRRHGTPHLGALHVRDVPVLGEVHPVGFVQLRPDEVV